MKKNILIIIPLIHLSFFCFFSLFSMNRLGQQARITTRTISTTPPPGFVSVRQQQMPKVEALPRQQPALSAVPRVPPAAITIPSAETIPLASTGVQVPSAQQPVATGPVRPAPAVAQVQSKEERMTAALAPFFSKAITAHNDGFALGYMSNGAVNAIVKKYPEYAEFFQHNDNEIKDINNKRLFKSVKNDSIGGYIIRLQKSDVRPTVYAIFSAEEQQPWFFMNLVPEGVSVSGRKTSENLIGQAELLFKPLLENSAAKQLEEQQTQLKFLEAEVAKKKNLAEAIQKKEAEAKELSEKLKQEEELKQSALEKSKQEVMQAEIKRQDLEKIIERTDQKNAKLVLQEAEIVERIANANKRVIELQQKEEALQKEKNQLEIAALEQEISAELDVQIQELLNALKQDFEQREEVLQKQISESDQRLVTIEDNLTQADKDIAQLEKQEQDLLTQQQAAKTQQEKETKERQQQQMLAEEQLLQEEEQQLKLQQEQEALIKTNREKERAQLRAQYEEHVEQLIKREKSEQEKTVQQQVQQKEQMTFEQQQEYARMQLEIDVLTKELENVQKKRELAQSEYERIEVEKNERDIREKLENVQSQQVQLQELATIREEFAQKKAEFLKQQKVSNEKELNELKQELANNRTQQEIAKNQREQVQTQLIQQIREEQAIQEKTEQQEATALKEQQKQEYEKLLRQRGQEVAERTQRFAQEEAHIEQIAQQELAELELQKELRIKELNKQQKLLSEKHAQETAEIAQLEVEQQDAERRVQKIREGLAIAQKEEDIPQQKAVVEQQVELQKAENFLDNITEQLARVQEDFARTQEQENKMKAQLIPEENIPPQEELPIKEKEAVKESGGGDGDGDQEELLLKTEPFQLTSEQLKKPQPKVVKKEGRVTPSPFASEAQNISVPMQQQPVFHAPSSTRADHPGTVDHTSLSKKQPFESSESSRILPRLGKRYEPETGSTRWPSGGSMGASYFGGFKKKSKDEETEQGIGKYMDYFVEQRSDEIPSSQTGKRTISGGISQAEVPAQLHYQEKIAAKKQPTTQREQQETITPEIQRNKAQEAIEEPSGWKAFPKKIKKAFKIPELPPLKKGGLIDRLFDFIVDLVARIQRAFR